MSGIAGIFNLDGAPVDPRLLGKMSAAIAHRGPDGEGRWIAGAAGMACQLFRVTPESLSETQPLTDSLGNVLVFDGRLDNRDELLAALKAEAGLTSESPDSVLALAAYRQWSERFAERLNGDFALAIFDARENRLLLARDVMGVRPLYYTRVGNAFLFGSEIKALLAHPQMVARPNNDHIAELLWRGPGSPNDGLTFFEDVHSVYPAHRVVVTPQRTAVERYWDFDPTRQIRFGSFPGYAEAYRYYFDQAVRRRLRSAFPVAIAVSGGVDSSSILCTAEILRREGAVASPGLFGLTNSVVNGSPEDESVFIADIERAYGISIGRVPMAAPGLPKGWEGQVAQVESPVFDPTGGITCRFHGAVRELGARVMVAGHWGDQMLVDQSYLIDLLHQFRWREAFSHLREYPRWFTDTKPNYFARRFFLDLAKYHVPSAFVPSMQRFQAAAIRDWDRPWYSRALRRRVRHRIYGRRHAPGPFASAHARSIYQKTKSAYYILCLECNSKVASGHGIEMAFPFLDRDLISFQMGIPGKVQTWNGVPKGMLREAMLGVLPDAIRERRWKADGTARAKKSLERDCSPLCELLCEDLLAARMGYADQHAVSEQVSLARRPLDAFQESSPGLFWTSWP